MAFIFILISFKTCIGPWYICAFSFVSYPLCSTCLIYSSLLVYTLFYGVFGGLFSIVERSVMFYVMSMNSEGVDVLDWIGKKHFRVWSIFLRVFSSMKEPKNQKINEILVKIVVLFNAFIKRA